MKTQDNSKKKNAQEKQSASKADALKKDVNAKDAPEEKFEGTLRSKTGERDK